jgi:hypothetical protein
MIEPVNPCAFCNQQADDAHGTTKTTIEPSDEVVPIKSLVTGSDNAFRVFLLKWPDFELAASKGYRLAGVIEV